MVNSGAIATTSLVPGANLADKWAVHSRRAVAFRRPSSCRSTRKSTPVRVATNFRNQSPGPPASQTTAGSTWAPAEALDLCCRAVHALNVSARDLAVMGATLANGGVNPLSPGAHR